MSSHSRLPTQTQRGRSGKKWVGLNYKEKEKAKEASGGVMPYTLSLVTSDFPHKDEWSEIDLPDILFYIQPPPSKYDGVKVEDLIEDGAPVASDAPDRHNIRQFEILPRNISLDVPGWLVEAWRRLDTRIGYQDILDRQYADPSLGLKKHTKNALQNHCRRECRKVLNTWVEYGRRDEPHRTEVEAIEGMSYENIQLNTTLKRSGLFNNRLVRVRLERRVEDGLYYAIPHEVTVENWKETTLPIDHFLPDSQPMEMTQSMRAAWEMYLILMERATVHGYCHWSKLERSCLPVTWYDRTTTKSIPNDTYDGGCATCTWSMDREIPSTPNIKPEPCEVLSTAKSKKRRRSKGRAELWDLGDTPKAPKRRQTTRLSMRRNSEPENSSSSAVEDVTFVETYRRDPKDYEYYSVSPAGKVREYDSAEFYEDSEGDYLSDEDAIDNSSTYEGNEEEEIEETQSDPDSCLKSDPFSSGDEDPFSSPSTINPSRNSGYRQLRSAAAGFSSPTEHSLQAEAWLRSSRIHPSTSSPPNLDCSSSIDENALIHPDLGGIPGYLPASAFSDFRLQASNIPTRGSTSINSPHRTSFASPTTLPGASFSSEDTSIFTAAAAASSSFFMQTSHTAFDQSYALPTPTNVGFPTATFYPLPMTQYNEVYHHLSYPSPPQTTTYQNQLSFNSSPPRRSESDWEWNQARSRRYSDSDAAVGLPSDFAGIGTFEHGLTAVSNYLDNQEYPEVLELPQAADENDYADSNAFDCGEYGNRDLPGQGHGLDDAAIVRTSRTNVDHDFSEEELDLKTGPFISLPGLMTPA